MIRALLGSVLLLSAAATCVPSTGSSSSDRRELIAGTTTTTQDTGLTDALVADFQRRSGYRVKLVVAGTGQILRTAARGEVDVVLTHSPAAEREFVRAGHGRERRLVMHNDFVVLGPGLDPGRVRGRDARSAFTAIAAAGQPFISRGDGSGTHDTELAIWSDAGIDPRGRTWYVESSAGQIQTLQLASQRGAYVLADRGTWLVHRTLLDLELLVEGGRDLLNIYHVMLVDPARFPKVNSEGARAFADYLVSAEGQAVIASFGVERFGQPLFIADAGRGESDLR